MDFLFPFAQATITTLLGTIIIAVPVFAWYGLKALWHWVNRSYYEDLEDYR